MGCCVFKACHLRPLVLWSALAVIALLPRLDAQKAQVAASEFTVHSEVDLLSVAVRVTDRKDNEVHGLTANQFKLYEDGKPQKISFFDAGSEPVSLGILLDVSGSMGGHPYGAGSADFRDLLAEEVCNTGLAPPFSHKPSSY